MQSNCHGQDQQEHSLREPWPSRTDCRSPAASRAKTGVRRCSCGNVWKALTVVGLQYEALRRRSSARREHYCDAADRPWSPDDYKARSPGACLQQQHGRRRAKRCPSLPWGTHHASASTTQLAPLPRPHGRGPSSCGRAMSQVSWPSARPGGVPSDASDGQTTALSPFQLDHSWTNSAV